jgi:hypothetical protein
MVQCLGAQHRPVDWTKGSDEEVMLKSAVELTVGTIETQAERSVRVRLEWSKTGDCKRKRQLYSKLKRFRTESFIHIGDFCSLSHYIRFYYLLIIAMDTF